jgi:hypothetical protein
VDPAADLCHRATVSEAKQAPAGALVGGGVPAGNVLVGDVCPAVETGWHWLTVVSLVFFWIAFAAWVIVAIELLLRFRRSRAADTPSGPTT